MMRPFSINLNNIHIIENHSEVNLDENYKGPRLLAILSVGEV